MRLERSGRTSHQGSRVDGSGIQEQLNKCKTHFNMEKWGTLKICFFFMVVVHQQNGQGDLYSFLSRVIVKMH